MKKLALTTLACVTAVCVLAQGTVNFANLGVGLNAPLYLDGVAKATGPAWEALLMGGPSAGSLAQYGSIAVFLTGGGAGYFTGGAATITTVAPGATGFFQVIAWDSTLGGTTTGATEPEAFAYWQAGHGGVWRPSYVFNVVTGGYGIPPSPPATLIGLSWVVIPEPSALTLATLGGACLLTRHRRPPISLDKAS